MPLQGPFVSPPFPSDPSDPVEVLEQLSFLHLQFEIAFLILNTAEDLLYVVHFDLVEEQGLEDAMDA